MYIFFCSSVKIFIIALLVYIFSFGIKIFSTFLWPSVLHAIWVLATGEEEKENENKFSLASHNSHQYSFLHDSSVRCGFSSIFVVFFFKVREKMSSSKYLNNTTNAKKCIKLLIFSLSLPLALAWCVFGWNEERTSWEKKANGHTEIITNLTRNMLKPIHILSFEQKSRRFTTNNIITTTIKKKIICRNERKDKSALYLEQKNDQITTTATTKSYRMSNEAKCADGRLHYIPACASLVPRMRQKVKATKKKTFFSMKRMNIIQTEKKRHTSRAHISRYKKEFMQWRCGFFFFFFSGAKSNRFNCLAF